MTKEHSANTGLSVSAHAKSESLSHLSSLLEEFLDKKKRKRNKADAVVYSQVYLKALTEMADAEYDLGQSYPLG